MEYLSNIDDLKKHLGTKKVDNEIKNEIINGININSMAFKISKYLFDLIDWKHPAHDPIRKQFLPFKKEYIQDHDKSCYDSLSETENKKNYRIIHRYPNKVLFLATKVCKSYCAFCTRSYLVGPSTNVKIKSIKLSSILDEISNLKDYLKAHKNITDVIISGGDVNTIKTSILDNILTTLGGLSSIKVVRIATRGFTFDPFELDENSEFYRVITKHSFSLRRKNIELSIQTHFNHSNEITLNTRRILRSYYQRNVIVRNQTVLLKNINDDKDSMINLIEKLIDSNVIPYYVYQMDMVKNTEHFRTKIRDSINLEKDLYGFFSGFYTPKFVIDLPDGGGKRILTQYEKYIPNHGCYEYYSCIDKDKICRYYDPL